MSSGCGRKRAKVWGEIKIWGCKRNDSGDAREIMLQPTAGHCFDFTEYIYIYTPPHIRIYKSLLQFNFNVHDFNFTYSNCDVFKLLKQQEENNNNFLRVGVV